MRKVLLASPASIVANERAPLEQLRLAPGVLPALLRLQGAGFEVVPSAPFAAGLDAFLAGLFESQGVRLATPAGLVPAELDFRRSAVVRAESDPVLPASLAALQLRTLTLAAPGAESWAAVARTLLDGPRTANVRRRTKETDIRVSIDLDREAEPRAKTGLGFFDHMLEQLGKHGGFALEVECAGDLHIDEHHTIEDVALALGQALREALGDKRGIRRYGFLLPMDEADAEVSIDLGGRPYLVFEGTFPREQVGGFPTELVAHFFRSLTETLGAAIHVRVRGENAHHMIEVCFKAVARALREAVKREGDSLPSTKGQL